MMLGDVGNLWSFIHGWIMTCSHKKKPWLTMETSKESWIVTKSTIIFVIIKKQLKGKNPYKLHLYWIEVFNEIFIRDFRRNLCKKFSIKRLNAVMLIGSFTYIKYTSDCTKFLVKAFFPRVKLCFFCIDALRRIVVQVVGWAITSIFCKLCRYWTIV